MANTGPSGPMADHLPGEWKPIGSKGFVVKQEDRGGGTIAVYVKGPASQIEEIERASRAYARHHLTFAPGLSGGPVSGGGEITDGGRVYVSQDIYLTRPLPPRTD